MFLSNLTHKILERSPLKYKLVRSIFCLSPKKVAEVPEECSEAFEAVLTKLIEAKWRASSEAMTSWNSAESSFILWRKTDSDFKKNRERVDTFLYGYISDKKGHQPLWKVFRLLLTLTQPGIWWKRIQCKHWSSDSNLKNETLISLRTVYDAVKSLDGDLSNFTIT